MYGQEQQEGNGSWLMFTQNTDCWRQRRDLVIRCANIRAVFYRCKWKPNLSELFFELENLNVIWKKKQHFTKKLNVAISIWANKYVSFVLFFIIIICIYWTFMTFQVHPQRKYGTASVKRPQKKKPSMLKYKENTFVTPMRSSYFLLAQFAQKKEKKRKKLSTLSQQRALCLFTPASLCWKHGPIWVHCTQAGMLVHFPCIFSHSWRISTG